MKTVFVDANVIIRHLLGDHPVLSLEARKQFVRAQSGEVELYLDEVIVAEVVWVLSSFYKIAREDISKQLLEIISQEWVVNSRKRLMIKSLEMFENNNLDYIDCWALNVAKGKKLELKSFDKKLAKMSGT
jgi:predicted nucleic-acid-binding protein